MTDKPVVEFGKFLGWGEHPCSGEMSATLGDVRQHPKLGNPPTVYTSRVERIVYDDDGVPNEIETRNTVYRRVA
ncbi:hypothetical protein ACYX7E_10005 [Luteimonas sp. RIT-PG2_3]